MHKEEEFTLKVKDILDYEYLVVTNGSRLERMEHNLCDDWFKQFHEVPEGFQPSSFYGIPLYVNSSLPPGVIEIRDGRGYFRRFKIN